MQHDYFAAYHCADLEWPEGFEFSSGDDDEALIFEAKWNELKVEGAASVRIKGEKASEHGRELDLVAIMSRALKFSARYSLGLDEQTADQVEYLFYDQDTAAEMLLRYG